MSQDVYHLIDALHLPLLQHLGNTQNLSVASLSARPVQEGVLRHQLGEVLVRRHHVGGEALGFGPLGQGADHVVGLPPGHPDHGDVECLAEPEDVGKGHAQVLRHRVSGALVLGVLQMAPRRLRSVEDSGDMGRILVAEYVQESVGEDEGR